MAQANEAVASADQGAADVARTSGWRVGLFVLKPVAMLLLLILLPAALQTAGAIRLQALGAWGERRVEPYAGPAALARALDALRRLPTDVVALAGEATQEGHWRFVNRAGETLTAGTPDEMLRVAGILLPQAQPDARLTVLLTPTSILDQRAAALKDLPKGTALRVVMGEESHAVLGRADVPTERLFIEVRPNVLVEATTAEAVREALWQLARPIDRAAVRVLALEAGGPSTLTPVPRKEPGTGKAMIDVLDPNSLGPAMGSVRGQTLIITGRVDAGVIYVQPGSGRERGLLVRDLFAAADGADVNLVVLESTTTPRQPGGRNWLWQKVEVKGLDEGLARPRLADLLNAVGGTSTRFLANVKADGAQRTLLQMTPAVGLPRSGVPSVGEAFMDAIGDLTGRVVTTSVQASLRSVVRQREIDRRVLPFLPSSAQLVYALLFALGLIGVPTAATWWRRIWPPENPGEYSNAAGYHAARLIRAAVFLLAFVPLAAVLAAPQTLIAWLAHPFRRRNAAGAMPREAS